MSIGSSVLGITKIPGIDSWHYTTQVISESSLQLAVTGDRLAGFGFEVLDVAVCAAELDADEIHLGVACPVAVRVTTLF